MCVVRHEMVGRFVYSEVGTSSWPDKSCRGTSGPVAVTLLAILVYRYGVLKIKFSSIP